MPEQSTRTVERALSLLATICDDRGLNLSEASRAVDLSPSTALRLLRTLEASGFVRKEHDGTYWPGSRLMQLGAQSLNNDSLVELCRPIMEHLVALTGESVYLGVKGHRATALYIAIVEGTHSVRHTSWVGRVIPIESSASGHVLLGRTPSDGYVVVDQGIEPDVTAIAAPIYSDDRIVASLSLVIPSYRITPRDRAQYGRALVAATADASAGLSKRILPMTEGEQP
ncbi:MULTISPECIES: IclR family transcriptional regulator [unclassified Cryobacterium]|uniref:IclR family transcriptional regulator n=1 Tax=unclassified Cryobacterium TaxID=2649013 RepID=UPI000CE464F4|nr:MULTISPECIES: IclR family transcriptional regulator [unclassified Cryobacterium]